MGNLSRESPIYLSILLPLMIVLNLSGCGFTKAPEGQTPLMGACMHVSMTIVFDILQVNQEEL